VLPNVYGWRLSSFAALLLRTKLPHARQTRLVWNGRPFAGVPSYYVNSHSGQLSLLSLVGRKKSTSQGPVVVLFDRKGTGHVSYPLRDSKATDRETSTSPKLILSISLITDRVNRKVKQSVASVCPSVTDKRNSPQYDFYLYTTLLTFTLLPLVSTLSFEPTNVYTWVLCVWVMTIARLELKAKVVGQRSMRRGKPVGLTSILDRGQVFIF